MFPLRPPIAVWSVRAAALCALASLATAQDDLLPADGEVVVVELRWSGGYGPPRHADPHLVIRADGLVTVRAPAADSPKVEGRIEAQRVRELLQQIAVEHRLLDYDSKAVAAAMAEVDRSRTVRTHIADASTLHLTLTTSKRSCTIALHAPDFQAKNYPDIRVLQDVVAAERVLVRLASEIAVGGADGIGRMCRAANAELQRKLPEQRELTAADFVGAERSATELVARFQRIEKTSDGKKQRLVARVTETGTKAPTVLVHLSPVPD